LEKFKTAIEITVANVTRLAPSQVNVTQVTTINALAVDPAIATTAASVVYVMIVPSGNTTAVTNLLNAAVVSKSFNSLLKINIGYSGAQAGDVAVVYLSPTSGPTPLPSASTSSSTVPFETTKGNTSSSGSTTLIIAAVVSVVGIVAIGAGAAYAICKYRMKRDQNPSAAIHEEETSSPVAAKSIFAMDEAGSAKSVFTTDDSAAAKSIFAMDDSAAAKSIFAMDDSAAGKSIFAMDDSPAEKSIFAMDDSPAEKSIFAMDDTEYYR
jgi:hypothetical protein